jgi:hypothetical protein
MGFKISNKEELRKSVIRPELFSESVAQGVNTNKAVFSIKTPNSNFQSGVIAKSRRLQDKDLVIFSQSDAIVSAIITTRHNEAIAFGRRSKSQYERGVILRDVSPVRNTPKTTREEVETQIRQKDLLASLIYSWTLNCGTTNQKILDTVFAFSDHYFKQCTLAEFFGAQARNLLQCGRMATQLIRNTEDTVVMFRPVPVETIYQYRKGQRIIIGKDSDVDIPRQVLIDVEKYNNIPDHEKPTVWVQKVNDKIVSFFTEKDLRIDYLQKQAVANLDGYPLAPLELAISALQQHINAQQYMNNNLVKGLGSKGYFTIKPLSNDPDGIEFLPNDKTVETMRKEMQKYMAGSYQNSATIPIFSGPYDIEFKSLNATAKDMEFLRLYDYTIALLCASFQIAPEEIGFSGVGVKSGGNEGDNAQIAQGQSKGLVALLTTLCTCVTQIVWEVFPDAKDTLQLEPTGLGKSSRMDDLKISKEKLQTSGTMGALWADSEKSETFPFGGDIPTSPVFHQFITRYMKMSEIRYHFLKIDEDRNNPALDFFVDVGINASYQQLKLGGGVVANEQVSQPAPMQLNEKSANSNTVDAELIELLEASGLLSHDELASIIDKSITDESVMEILSKIPDLDLLQSLGLTSSNSIDPSLVVDIDRLLS